MNSNSKNNPKVIAFYLPQYHSIPENDEWWGKGFTEWTNVGRAKSLFKGHYQPRVPADLGYYDLRLPETRVAQADLAKQHGVDGFCYYHYWFENGKRLLERPFTEVLESGSPDFPFMLCWANESWHSKFWDYNGVSQKKLLIEQVYGNEKEYEAHFYAVLDSFKDKRYIKIDGKPAFMIYESLKFPDVDNFIKVWQKLAIENGFNGIHFIGQTQNSQKDKDTILSKGFNAINAVRIHNVLQKKNKIKRIITKTWRTVFQSSLKEEYSKAIKYFTNTKFDKAPDVYPTIVPNWDHTPRSGKKGFLLHNSTPEYFSVHVNNVFNILKEKPVDKQICFIKSWNEWAEGNYMEPDLKYGTKYLEVLKAAKDKMKKGLVE